MLPKLIVWPTWFWLTLPKKGGRVWGSVGIFKGFDNQCNVRNQIRHAVLNSTRWAPPAFEASHFKRRRQAALAD